MQRSARLKPCSFFEKLGALLIFFDNEEDSKNAEEHVSTKIFHLLILNYFL